MRRRAPHRVRLVLPRGGSRRFLGLALAAILVPGLVTGCASSRTPADLAADALLAGISAQRAGDLDAARRGYLEALRSDPRNVYAFYNLGVVSAAQDDPVRADYHYRIALGLDPVYVPALLNLGLLVAEAGGTEEALELYQRAALVAPSIASTHYRLGVLYASMGRTDESEASLTAAKTLELTISDETAFIPLGPYAEGSEMTPAATLPSPSPSPAP